MANIEYSYADDSTLLDISDLTCDTAGTTITSATGGFLESFAGKSLHIISGTGFTPGYYTIASVTSTNTATVSASVGSDGIGGTATIGCAFDNSVPFRVGSEGDPFLGQTFRVDAACDITSVKAKVYNVYSGSGATGSMEVAIWTEDDAVLVAECLSAISSAVITDSPAGQWVTFSVRHYDDELGYIPARLLAGTTYKLVINMTGGHVGYWLHDSDGTYSYGVAGKFVWDTYPVEFHYEETSGVHAFQLEGEYVSLSKPTNPTPADGSGPGINFANHTVSWVNGGGAETYTVRMGTNGVAYNVVSLSQAGTSYTIPEGDISLYKDAEIAWRVDAEAGGETARGDVWTFDPRPAKATTPSPTNGASNTALNLTTLSWVKDAYTDTSEVNCSWSGSVSPFSTSSNSIALADYTPLYMDRLGYSNTYTWSVDTTNEWGTTDGDDWTFDTISYSGASCSWKNYDGKTKGPGVENGDGVEGVDYYWTGDNCISTVKRVVAFAADRVWITEV